MYESFFGLKAEPFSIAADPRFLFLSDKHREALALLNYGLSRGASFVLLTGEIGAGKTTVWRRFLEELPSNVDVANVANPKLDVDALLTRICEDLRVELPPGPVDLLDRLHGHLLLAYAQGRRTLIVIDEAQALADDVLEQLRLLTNLDASGKRLQVLLIGQPELRQMLQRPQFEPLAQRVVARYHLPALSAAETAGYIDHRLRVAGLAGPLPFDGGSLATIHRLSHGIPRRINVLCDRSMVAAYATGVRAIESQTVESAAAEAFGDRPLPPPAARRDRPRVNPAMLLAGGGVAAMALAAGVLLGPRLTAPPVPAVAAVPTPPASGQAALAPAPALTLSAPSLESVFDGPAATNDSQAWRALAAVWGVTLGPGEPCAVAARQSLLCHRSTGGLALVRLLDRPGLLKLVDDRGRIAHVLLTAVADDSVTLTIAGVERNVPLARLARLWRGEFATFWQAPPGYREGGASDAALARWLDERLAGSGRAQAAGDESLRSRVVEFQLTCGLPPDGVPGPLTLMLLNRASGVAEPRLKAATSGSRPS